MRKIGFVLFVLLALYADQAHAVYTYYNDQFLMNLTDCSASEYGHQAWYIETNQAQIVQDYLSSTPSADPANSLWTTPTKVELEFKDVSYIRLGDECGDKPADYTQVLSDGVYYRIYIYECADDSSLPFRFRKTYWQYKRISTTIDPNADYDADGTPNCSDYYPNDATQSVPPAFQDNDDDGIQNQDDPFPDDARDFTWRKVMEQGDDWAAYEVMDADGNVQLWTTGTYDSSEPYTLFGSSAWQAQDDWPLSGGEGSPGAAPDSAGDYVYNPNGPDYADGTAGDGSSTDNVALNAIQANTAAMAANQAAQGQQLLGINDTLIAQNQILEAIKTNTATTPVAGGGGISEEGASLIGSSVAQEIADEITGDENQNYASEDTVASAAFDTATAAYENFGNLTNVPEGYQSKTDLGNQLDNVLSSEMISDVQGVITGSGVDATGSCSFGWNYNGGTVQFSVCDYASVLNDFGVVLVAFASLVGLLVVFKR